MIVAGFLMLLVIAPLAVFWGDARVVAGLACCVAALALWRAAALQEKLRVSRGRPSNAADVIRQLTGWVAQRRREPIVSQSALDRGREYATGVQDGAYATLDEVLDRLAEMLRVVQAPGGQPPAPPTRPAPSRGHGGSVPYLSTPPPARRGASTG
ncbi:MAG TPA: hypothetical protein VLJ59_20225 [Mycobacteriales bacterium]|nr:hypothetical protein [Mycobacteriales bacterium]